MVRDLDETDVPKELATSLAPKQSVIIREHTSTHTNVPRIEAGKDDGQGKDVVILMEYRHLLAKL